MGTDTTLAFTTCREFMRNGMTVAELLMSNILPRFPKLNFVSVESGVGWIPFVLESLDKHAQEVPDRREHPEYTELPSFYFHRQVYANCWYEHLTDYHMRSDRSGQPAVRDGLPAPHVPRSADEIADAIELVTGAFAGEPREDPVEERCQALPRRALSKDSATTSFARLSFRPRSAPLRGDQQPFALEWVRHETRQLS